MTVKSFTSDKVYETTLESCTCGDYIYRQSKVGGHCKHQKALFAAHNRATYAYLLCLKLNTSLSAEVDKAQEFLRQKALFDCRSQAVIEEKRANYFYFETALAS